MSQFDVDLFVIGAGSGGVRAARIAAGHGARVAIAEEYRVGGTCVIRGCVPKKLMVYASRFSHEFEDAAGFGWRVPEPTFDWATLIRHKDAEIARLEGIYRSNLDKAGVRLIESRATLEDAHTIRLNATGQTLSARTLLVATGARPSSTPDFPGREHTITSNEVFHLPALPSRVTVIGGGYIAVEFAGIFAGLGAQTTLVHRGEHILRGFDDDLRTGVEAAYVKQGITLHLERTVQRVDKLSASYRVTLSDGSSHEADIVMMATGRDPNTEGLGLEQAGVRLAASGAVQVDDDSRSNVPSIYAVGDVTDRVALTPMAIREGHAFADTVFGGRSVRVDHSRVPTAVFSTPEIGTIGPTEAQARERYPALRVYKAGFKPMKATLSGRDERVFMKLLVDGDTDKVVGAHLLGEGMGELIQVIGVAVTMGVTKAAFDQTLAVHPTAAEELVTMRTPA